MVGWRIVKGNPKFAGGAVAHIGLAVMFLGFVASSKFDEKRTISLEQGKPQLVMGYQMTYTGYHPIGNDKYAFRVHVLHEGKEFTVAPIMYYSAYTDGLMRNPDVRNLISRDFYLAPLSLEQPSNIAEAGTQKVQLKLGETKKAGTVDVRFVDFEFPSDQREKMLAGQDVEIGARVQVRLPNGATMEAVPKKIMHQGQMTDKPASVASDATGSEGYEVTLGTMHPDQENRENSSVEISVKDLAAAAVAARDAAGKGDILVAEASVKPYINLVWSGVIILLVGFLITIVRRSQEATAAAEAARNVEPEARDVAPELADGVQSGIA
jgi:cytochrome c-type biogenesis protein CcmF